MRVLYEDNHLIAVYKPAGVLVQGDATGDPTLLDEVKYYLKNKHHKLGRVFLGVIHRLDRPVQGIVLLAKTSKGAARLSEQFRAHTVEKTYRAVVIGRPDPAQARLVHYLKKDSASNRVTATPLPTPGSQEARLRYTVEKTNGAFSLVNIILETGRPHQIRAQLAAIGHPIVGDVKYGAPEPLPDKSLALAATSLRFTTATGDEEKKVTAPLPAGWSQFAVCG